MTNQDRKVLLVGRDPADIATIYNFGGPITDSPVSSTRDDAGVWTGGNIRQWVDELTTAVIDHHASGFIYRPSEVEHADTAFGRWAQEIAPAVREAIWND